MSNAYEIRSNLLHLAKDILTENAHMEAQNARDHNKPLDIQKSITMEQIITEAEKLYVFVSKK